MAFFCTEVMELYLKIDTLHLSLLFKDCESDFFRKQFDSLNLIEFTKHFHFINLYSSKRVEELARNTVARNCPI